MSSDFSQLPANCSSDLQQFCLEKSEDEMLSSLENNPEKLLDFFEVACADRQWRQNNDALFQKLTEKIAVVEQSYNPEQIEKISGICEGILTSPEHNPIQEPIVEVYRHSLNLEHALSMVTKEGLDPSSVIVKECLAFLEKDTGQKISRSDDAKIEIIITQINNETDQLLAIISEWDANIRDKIDIHICPEEGISKESLDALAEKYGKYANH